MINIYALKCLIKLIIRYIRGDNLFSLWVIFVNAIIFVFVVVYQFVFTPLVLQIRIILSSLLTSSLPSEIIFTFRTQLLLTFSRTHHYKLLMVDLFTSNITIHSIAIMPFMLNSILTHTQLKFH